MAKHPFIWEAHEYTFQEKSSDWYWAVGIVAVSVSIISIIFGNILLALLVLLGSFALSLFASKRPSVIKFEINKTGILINRTLYPYGTLESFWVEDNRHLDLESKLFIKSQRMAVPIIIIPLEGMDPEDIRDFLLDHLLEEHHVESAGQKLLEYLGF